MLNETQRQVLDGYLNFPLSDIMENEDVSPRQALIAMQVLYEIFNSGKYTLYNRHRQTFNTLDILDSINQIIDIYKHPHPQKRTTNYPYFAAPTDNTMIVYKNQNGAKAFEKKGLLSLSAQNDNTSAAVTKEDVIRFICNILQQRIELLKQKATIYKLRREHRIKQDALYAQKLQLEEYRQLDSKHDQRFSDMQKKHEKAEIELDRIKRRMQELQRNSFTLVPQQNIPPSPVSLEKLKKQAGENYALAKTAIFEKKYNEAVNYLFLAKRNFKELKRSGINCDTMLRKIKDKLTELQPRVRSRNSLQPALPAQPPPSMRRFSLKNIIPKCIKTLCGHSDSVHSVCFNHDSTLIVSGSGAYSGNYPAEYDNTVRIWDAITGKCIKTLEGHSNLVSSVRFSPGGVFIASGSADKTIKIWGVRSGKCIRTLKGHSNRVCSVHFNHDSTLIVSGSYDRIRIWEVRSGKCIKNLKNLGLVYSVCFNHDSTLVAVGCERCIYPLSTKTYKAKKVLRGHSPALNSICFNYNSTLIVSGGCDNNVQIWDIITQKLIKIFKGHSKEVKSVCFNHDSSLIVSGSEDKTIKIWDVRSGKCIRTIKGHSGSVNSVHFNHDSTIIISGSGDTTIKIWKLNT